MTNPPRPISGSPNAGDVWTSRRLLEWMTKRFADQQLDSPRLVAEMLLSHVIKCERLKLYMEVDRPASPEELARLRELVARAITHEPVQYLTGEAWFIGKPYSVTPASLIPRPSTETLVEGVARWCREHKTQSEWTIADIGTGSGCIGISLLLQLPHARLIATDISPEAIELSKENATRHGVHDRIEFREGSGLEPLTGEMFDVICSNPPYIPDREWDTLPDNVKMYEPASALQGGKDGMEVIRPLIAQAGQFLKPGGLLAIEIADGQRDLALSYAEQAGDLTQSRVERDHEGFWRVLFAERAASK